MKLTAIFLLAVCLHVSAGGYSQGVHLDANHVPLRTVFAEIEQQTGYLFFYTDDDLASARPVTIHASNLTLPEVLTLVLQDQPLTYTIIGSTIIVKTPVAAAPQTGDTTKVPLVHLRGRVIDSLGNGLNGAYVQVEGSKRVIPTDQEGQFDIADVGVNSTLIVSFTGYKTKKVALNGQANVVNGHADMVVMMSVSSQELTRLTVNYSTGYQQIPKERATGSFEIVDNKLFNREVGTDVLSRLDGITNGVFFDKTQGSNNKIIIRGYSTLNANSSPLVVVDNFPYDGDLNNINPNDVENITILKDAAAASIWGARAGNGVIVITTKKGKKNQPVKIEANVNMTITQKPALRAHYQDEDFLDSKDFIYVEQYLFNQGFYDAQLSDPSYPPVSPVVSLLDSVRNGRVSQAYANGQIDAFKNKDVRDDLMKYFYRPQVNQQYSINLRGGTAKSIYYFSAGYDKNLLTQVGNSFDRLTLSSVNTYMPVKNLELTTGVIYTQTNSISDNTLGQITTGYAYGNVYPYASLADSKGKALPIVKDYSQAFTSVVMQNGFLDWQFRPLQELRNAWNTTHVKVVDTRMNVELKYHILPGLSAAVSYQYERGMSNYNTLETKDSYAARNVINQYSVVSGNTFQSYIIPVGDILNYSTDNTYSEDGRGQLNYDRRWGKHAVNALGGAEVRETKTTTNEETLYGYDHNLGTVSNIDFVDQFQLYPYGYAGTIPNGDYVSGALTRFTSVFSNASYSYDGRYIFSTSARRDASNLFGVNSNNRVKPLWSAGALWDVSKEHFYTLTWLPQLKLGITYGYSGNIMNNILAITTIRYGGSAPYTNLPEAGISSFPNPNLKWENVGMLNMRLEFATRNEILSGSLQYFVKNSQDLIAEVPVDPTMGVSGYLNENSAHVRGHGIDLQLNSKNITGIISWETGFLLSYYKDKVIRYLGGSATPVASSYAGLPGGPSPIVGQVLMPVFAYKWAGLDPTNGDPQGYYKKAVSKDYAAIQNDSVSSLVYKGSAMPLLYGSLMNTFRWKRVSLSANITFSFLYYFHKTNIEYTSLYSNWIGHPEFAKRWQKPGDEKTTSVPSMDYPGDSYRDAFYNLAEPNFLRGDHIRLKDIRIGYDLPVNDVKKDAVFKSLSVYLYMDKLPILWRANKEKLDPDYISMPPPRSFAFGIRAGF